MCRSLCLDIDYWYFSKSFMDSGTCCDPTAAQAPESTCVQAGYSSIEALDHMKYFLCPQGYQCGPEHIIVRTKHQTYSIDSSALRDNENICNHVISFPLDAGINDILKIKFISHNPGTIVNFSVGKSFSQSSGETITDLTNKLLKVGFPNKIFLSI